MATPSKYLVNRCVNILVNFVTHLRVSFITCNITHKFLLRLMDTRTNESDKIVLKVIHAHRFKAMSNNSEVLILFFMENSSRFCIWI